MLKKTITYTDYNGVSRTEDFYFNLSRAEILRLEFTSEGGSLSEAYKEMMDAKNVPELYKLFEKIIGLSYGVKSPDGRRFVKDETSTKEFMQSEAYSELIQEFFSDETFAAAFFSGLISSNSSDSAAITAPFKVV